VLLRAMGRVVPDASVSDADLRAAIYRLLSEQELAAAIDDADRIMRPLNDDYFDLLADRYGHLREFAQSLLNAFNFRSSDVDQELVSADRIGPSAERVSTAASRGGHSLELSDGRRASASRGRLQYPVPPASVPEPQRDAGNLAHRYDLAGMRAAVEREGGGFTLFGGDALSVPKRELEALWSWGLEKYGNNGVQTNGTLIDHDHVRLFKQYKMHVGTSIDGPGGLNGVGWNGTLEGTRAATAQTETAIERLRRAGTPPSLITTPHRANATADKLPTMHAWLRGLAGLGVR
jgi:hypothetical protein